MNNPFALLAPFGPRAATPPRLQSPPDPLGSTPGSRGYVSSGSDPYSFALNSVSTHPSLGGDLRRHLANVVQKMQADPSPMNVAMIQQEALKNVPQNDAAFARMLFAQLSNSIASQQAGVGGQ